MNKRKNAGLSAYVGVGAVLALIYPGFLYAQTEGGPTVSTDTNTEPVVVCAPADDKDPADRADPEPDSAACRSGDSLSNYDQSLSDTSSGKSVEAELVRDDTVKPAVFPIDVVHSRLAPFYNLKDKINNIFGLTWGTDLSVLAQHSSFTESGEDTAASSVFRILGTWLRIGDRDGAMGNLVWKMETRNPIGDYPTPRDMGFDTGSALSTANFKELDYWGITDLYWKQQFRGGQYRLLVGHMDPGDWADQYPLLNAWTSFMSDAFYNNPTEAIPKRGFGMVGQIFFNSNMYIAGGVHDANGKDGKLDFESFWETREAFSWAEIGYRSQRSISARHNTHLHYWHQDAREEAGTEKSWGIVYTYSYVNDKDRIVFLRAGYSRGDAAQMRRFVGIGMSYKIFGRDTYGIATSWGSPPEKSLRDQITSEIFYRLQVTQNITITPNFQLTYKPSLTLETKWVRIPGLRMRMVF